jgi:hypothetical protein
MKYACSFRFALLLMAAHGLLGAASPQADPPPKPSVAPPRTDYKVVVWYRRNQPLETFKYQAYDVRKGEYTPAVDSWVELMRTKYPGYEVLVRSVDLAREKGQTEALKVGSVIQRELMVVASLEGVFIGDGVTRGSPRTRTSSPLLSGGAGRTGPQMTTGPRPSRAVDLNPPSATFPVPMPYPRPHP